MKHLLFFIIMAASLASCEFSMLGLGGKDAIDSIQVVRYDRVEARYLTTGDFAALKEMNTIYPTQTRALIEDLLRLGDVDDININKTLLNYFQDSTLQDVIYAAESEFADMEDINSELRKAFGRLRKELPDMQVPKFYAQIGAFQQSIVVDDNAIGISLDKYLGEDYPHYHRYYDASQRRSMSRRYIVPDCIIFYLLSLYYFSDYDTCLQHTRDLHMGIIMWVTNKMTGRHAFSSHYISMVDRYMKSNPQVTIAQLLATQDYSPIFDYK